MIPPEPHPATDRSGVDADRSGDDPPTEVPAGTDADPPPALGIAGAAVGSQSTDPPPRNGRFEYVALHNHDEDEFYPVAITVTDPFGRTVRTHTVDVPPADVRSVRGRFAAGPYSVAARIPDDVDRTEVRLGRDPGDVALVEVGNGVVSVSGDWP